MWHESNVLLILEILCLQAVFGETINDIQSFKLYHEHELQS